ncbi:multifunctional protein ADE2-like [Hydractinia symbiolongicarpus]|uniref:multifunctional protein ADE2-like n=1 Tax=Hydractinia symbiolongicarpus TaxID=13093 RepID=UPI00254F2DFE|nr:multifunctional protein ADE2-like [Hydractinia symbiolongicarpus]
MAKKVVNSSDQENVVIEGKTKVVYNLPEYENGKYVLLQSKDQITCGDGARKDILEGKGALSNATNGAVFEFLNQSGVRTHFHKSLSETECIVEHCDMIPLEVVTRRLITGSYLRRNPGVEEGYRFPEPKMEYFFKDDANHDPQWSREQILSAKLSGSGVIIGEHELNEITEVALACFQILEKAWASRNCVLVDMKVEFGITKATKEVVLADVIDNDSWRLWPAGDKRLMRDKQVYRNLKEVTSEAMVEIKKNYAWVAEEAKKFSSKPSARAVILMGSSSDTPHCTKIANYLKTLGVPSDVRVSSAHKGSEETLRILHYYESHSIPTVFIAVAGRSNGLGPVLAGNTSYPVINCPPIKADWGSQDIWSSLRLPSGLGCTTIVDTEGAALAAAQILGMTDHNIWCKLRGRRLNFTVKLMHDDKKVVAENNK